MPKANRPTELSLSKPPSSLYPGVDGRLYVDLWVRGVKHTRQVLGLIAAAYDGPCPRGLAPHYLNGDTSDHGTLNVSYRLAESWQGGTAEILHLNGNIQDNRPTNLAYISDTDR